ncbi:MAG: tetratricopeptide repeat protein [Sphingobacteriales bacterium]|nr:MAG: tetratricopeptide repeat protein [Sphingobacteriales bacterium]
MKSFSIILLTFFLSVHVCSQKQGQEFIDSLCARVPLEPNDTIKAKIYNKVGLYYVQVNIDSAEKYARKGLALATRMKWDRGISAFYTIFGSIDIVKAQFDSGLIQYNTSLEYSKKIKDSMNIAGSYINLGAVANAKSDYIGAARYYSQALDIANAIKDYYNIGVASENLALVYQYQEDYEKALSFARQSLVAYSKLGEEENYLAPIALLGDIFLKIKKFDSCFYYCQQAINIAHRTNDELKEGAVLNSLVNYYIEQGDYANALNAALDGKKIFDRVGPVSEDATDNRGLLGYCYFKLVTKNGYVKSESTDKFLDSAAKYLTQAVEQFKITSNKNEQAEFQKSLAEVNALKGDYKNAYLNFKNYHELNDSIFSQANKNKLAAVETQNEMDKKNGEIEKQKLQVKEQKKNMLLLVMGLVMMTAIGFLFYRVSAIRKQKNNELIQLNKELDEANKVKAKFFGILSHDLRSPVANLVNFLALRKIKPDALTTGEATEREEKITRSAQSLLDTMENMLLWSKSQMQQFKPQKKTILVKDQFDYIESFFSGVTDIRFQFNTDEKLEVVTDENYLRTIMQNLTQNAVNVLKNIPDAVITWSARKEEGMAYLSISDNGTGMNEMLQKRFEESMAVDSSKHGLGFQIIKDLAKAIDCQVQLDVGAEQGTTFVLSFAS